MFTARHYMRQVVGGLLYLHRHGILHRDLTLANLLLTKDMDVVSLYTTQYYSHTRNLVEIRLIKKILVTSDLLCCSVENIY